MPIAAENPAPYFATWRDRYQLVGKLGSGAFADVFEAYDRTLDEHVALKIVPDGRALSARIVREVEAAAALDHPNIVALYDWFSDDDGTVLVWELVRGESLDRIGERLDDGDVVAIGVELLDALAFAHHQGIIHRDVKPQNVMLSDDGHVKVMDFGVAHLMDSDTLTRDGDVIGTIAYMSPEQVRGEAVDHRSDIFGLGVILYESLAGRHPFSQPTAAETMSAILRDEAPPLPGIEADLDWIVRHALEKSRDARFQSALDLALALESFVQSRQTPSPVPMATEVERPPRTIAVLPFANLTAGQDNEYFSDGLTEELIQALTRVRGLQVVAWHSAVQLKGRERDAQALGRDLNVSSVLAGTVRQARDRVRIAARLIEVASGYILWSETYDRRVEDVFAIQEEIAKAIVDTLTRALAGARPAGIGLRGRPATNVEAYNLYLKGRFFWNKRTAEGLTRSVECFEAALAIDPQFALAHAGLADACCLLTDYGIMAPADVMPRARTAAIRALELDPRSAEAHASFAYVRSHYDWEWPEAEALYRRAIELGPGYATAHHWFGIDFLALLGRFDEAAEQADVAQQLDPLSLIIQEGRGYLLMLARRYDEAIDAYRSLVDLDPSFYKGYTSMGRATLHKGEYAQAIELLEKGRQLAGDLPSILGALGQARAMAGERDEAHRLLEALSAMSTRRHVPSTAFALIHAGLGEDDAALDWLEKGCALHELPVSAINVHPGYDSLRGHARFTALLRRMRFVS
jgi:TolB-like protein/tetratricopeptide (TPR) repeat protein